MTSSQSTSTLARGIAHRRQAHKLFQPTREALRRSAVQGRSFVCFRRGTGRGQMAAHVSAVRFSADLCPEIMQLGRVLQHVGADRQRGEACVVSYTSRVLPLSVRRTSPGNQHLEYIHDTLVCVTWTHVRLQSRWRPRTTRYISSSAVSGTWSVGVEVEVRTLTCEQGQNEFAAFDPVFYLHHCNVDRIYALWEYVYPNYRMGAWHGCIATTALRLTLFQAGDTRTSRRRS